MTRISDHTVMVIWLFALALVAFPPTLRGNDIACQVLGPTFTAESRDQLQHHSVAKQGCTKMQLAAKICRNQMLPASGNSSNIHSLLAQLSDAGCTPDYTSLNDKEAGTQIMKAILEQWPSADGTAFSTLSDEILFALYVSPESLSVLMANSVVYNNWLSRVQDLSFAGMPERKDGLEKFKQALCQRLKSQSSSTELVQTLSKIHYRNWD